MAVRRSDLKLWLARAQDATGIHAGLLRMQALVLGPHARAVNYHAAHPEHVENFGEQVAWYARNFVPVGMQELLGLQQGVWPHSRPGLIVSFDDGLREPYDHAVPILERYGFRGWFFVPTSFVDAPPALQRAFAEEREITLPAPCDAPRIALSWDEIRDLDRRGHVIGSHTCTHQRMKASLPPASVRSEILASKQVLEAQLGHEVPVFCWVGGEEDDYSAEGAAVIRDAGYRIAFQTHSRPIRPGSNLLQIQRTNIEAWNPLALVRFQLSGFMDLLSRARRRRVERLTA